MIISKTPLRISFVGGGSDNLINQKDFEGKVLSTTINKFVYLCVNKKFDNNIRFSYSITENVSRSFKLHHPIARNVLKHFKISNGLEISSIADIPSSGSGLGSSSAFLVGLINCLNSYKNKTMSKKDLAKLACNIELIKMRQPIGMQDQYSAAYGGFNSMIFKNNKVIVNKFLLNIERLKKFEESLVLVSTNKTRDANTILRNVKNNRNIKSLKEIVNLVDIFKYELCFGDINNLGRILNESWIKKKELSRNVSNNYLDSIYGYALKQGALGGKLLGAGGGGFFLFFINKNYKKNFLNKMKKFNIVDFNFYNLGSKIIYND
jgi:D-glycero-alpha-D-manno-heptose-7-phosphate kinase